jgi:CheY-like chemotaxis protein
VARKIRSLVRKPVRELRRRASAAPDSLAVRARRLCVRRSTGIVRGALKDEPAPAIPHRRRSVETALAVLVVEEDAGTRSVIESLLARKGYAPVGTGDGLDAVRRARAARPVAALVGLMLPGQSGCRVIEDLRAEFGPHLDITALSAFASPALADYALAVGANRVLTKPLTATHLLGALAHLPAPGAPAQTARAGAG